MEIEILRSTLITSIIAGIVLLIPLGTFLYVLCYHVAMGRSLVNKTLWVLFVLGSVLAGGLPLVKLGNTFGATEGIPGDDPGYQYTTGSIASIALENNEHATLIIQDELGTKWRIPLSLYGRQLPHEPLEAGLKVRFPRRYPVCLNASLSKATITWREHFNEMNVGSPPLTFLDK